MVCLRNYVKPIGSIFKPESTRPHQNGVACLNIFE